MREISFVQNGTVDVLDVNYNSVNDDYEAVSANNDIAPAEIDQPNHLHEVGSHESIMTNA